MQKPALAGREVFIMDKNNIKEIAQYYPTDALESIVRSGRGNQYFIESNGVYEVSHKDPESVDLNNTITANVAMLGDGFDYTELHNFNVDVDFDNIDNIQEFAFNVGVPYEEIDPGFNEDGEYVNDVSYGELAEAGAELPGKIMEYAEKNGIAVLPVYQAENDTLSTEVINSNYSLVGFVSEKIPEGMSIESAREDLDFQVQAMDAMNKDEVYEVKRLTPKEGWDLDKWELFGSDPDDNGLSNLVDFHNFLGHYDSFEEASKNHDLPVLVENEWNRVNGRDEFELEAKYDARNSFYGKAKVTDKDFIRTLYSYDTPVLQMDSRTRELTRLIDDISPTTARHMKEFLLQQNVDVDKMKGKSITAKLATIPGKDYGKDVEAAKLVRQAISQNKEQGRDQNKDKNDPNR